MGSFYRLGPEKLQKDILEASRTHFARWASKYSKTAVWRFPGLTLWAGPRNVSKRVKVLEVDFVAIYGDPAHFVDLGKSL